MPYYTYILYSEYLDLYYIGSSKNPNARLQKHLAKHKGFTSIAKDWIICYVEKFETRSEAYRREIQLKSWKNKLRIKQLIDKSPKKLDHPDFF